MAMVYADHAFIKINGHKYPQPKRPLGLRVATIVDGARNGNAVFVGQKIGRDQHKIESLEWGHLTAEVWSALLREFDSGFVVTVEFPDMVTNSWQTKEMYPGDRTATPLWISEETGLPTDYIECKVNLIDTGK